MTTITKYDDLSSDLAKLFRIKETNVEPLVKNYSPIELAELSEEELQKLYGIGPKKSIRLKDLLNLAGRIAATPRASTKKVNCPEDVSNLLGSEMQGLDREVFRVILLNTKNSIITVEVVSIGTLSSSMAHPREVFRTAIRRSAAGIILVHNHPSGDPTPSNQDVSLTHRLVSSGALIGISILDHIIIGHNSYVCLKTRGLLNGKGEKQ